MTEPPCKQKCDDLSAAPPGALYLHVPFCARKCRYCDFYSLPYAPRAAGDYVEAALAELRLGAACLATPLASVFVGGGTPTALAPPLLRQLLAAAGPLIDARTECTVEANPGTVTPPTADMLAECGVNRVSLGAQSFDSEELQTLGRIHTPEEIASAVETMRRAGIANLSLDLIYAIPGQTLESWRRSLESALALGPLHLSAYALSFEEGTPLGQLFQEGRVAAMDEQLQRECYDAAIEAAAGAGMEHYEISNFALPGRRCRHNLTYWHNRTYLGVGPASASYVAGVRRTNSPDLEAYVRAWREGRPPSCWQEELSPRMVMGETMMLGLRLREGIDRAEFALRFGLDVMDAFPASIRRHLDLGTLELTDSHVRIARGSLFVSDAILADVIEEAKNPEH